MHRSTAIRTSLTLLHFVQIWHLRLPIRPRNDSAEMDIVLVRPTHVPTLPRRTPRRQCLMRHYPDGCPYRANGAHVGPHHLCYLIRRRRTNRVLEIASQLTLCLLYT